MTSEIIEHSPQPDGRAWVTELHVFDSGEERRATYMLEPGADRFEIMAARASQIEEEEAARVEEAAQPESVIVRVFQGGKEIASYQAETVEAALAAVSLEKSDG